MTLTPKNLLDLLGNWTMTKSRTSSKKHLMQARSELSNRLVLSLSVMMVLLFGLLSLTLVQPVSAEARTAWSRTKTLSVTESAMKTYHYTPAMKRNFRRYIIDIVYIGYAESHGRYWDDTGSCWGLLQFQHIGKCTGAGCGRGWHLNKRDKERHKKLHKRYKNVRDWRLCPECSVYRIARAYKEGGKATLDQHWAATLGR